MGFDEGWVVWSGICVGFVSEFEGIGRGVVCGGCYNVSVLTKKMSWWFSVPKVVDPTMA